MLVTRKPLHHVYVFVHEFDSTFILPSLPLCVLMHLVHTGMEQSIVFVCLVTDTANIPFRKRLRSADINRYATQARRRMLFTRRTQSLKWVAYRASGLSGPMETLLFEYSDSVAAGHLAVSDGQTASAADASVSVVQSHNNDLFTSSVNLYTLVILSHVHDSITLAFQPT